MWTTRRLLFSFFRPSLSLSFLVYKTNTIGHLISPCSATTDDRPRSSTVIDHWTGTQWWQASEISLSLMMNTSHRMTKELEMRDWSVVKESWMSRRWTFSKKIPTWLLNPRKCISMTSLNYSRVSNSDICSNARHWSNTFTNDIVVRMSK